MNAAVGPESTASAHVPTTAVLAQILLLINLRDPEARRQTKQGTPIIAEAKTASSGRSTYLSGSREEFAACTQMDRRCPCSPRWLFGPRAATMVP